MQKREYALLGLVMIIAVFAVIGNMPLLLADENDSGNNEDDSDENINDSNDEENETEDDTEENDDENDSETEEETIKENCIIKIEKSIKTENGKRVEVIKRKMKCRDGVESEFKVKIENRTEDGRYRERIKYEFRGKNLEVEAEDDINIEEDTNGTEYKLKARLKNGNITNIKIMPDRASQIAAERLKALNFTIQLKEKIHKIS